MNATSILCRAQAVDDASPGAWGEDIEQVLGSQDRANDKNSEEPSTIRPKRVQDARVSQRRRTGGRRNFNFVTKPAQTGWRVHKKKL